MSVIPQRRIGRDGPLTGVLSLGSWHTYDRMDFREAVNLVRTAVDSGITLFDVGVYGFPGATPVYTDVLFSAMVRAAGLRREDYLLSAKLWLEGYPEHNLRDQLDNALFRAGVEHADLVVLGDLRRDDTDLHRLVLDLNELREAGLIRHWGVNNWSATTIQALHDFAAAENVPGPAIAQLKYSVARRSIPDGEPFKKVFGELGVTLQSSDIFEGGVLLGKNSGARQVGRDPGDIRERIAASAPELAKIATELGATPAQLCLAFTLTHPANTTTLFGATSTEQLKDNLGAVDLVERVGAEELRALVEPHWADRDIVDPEGP
ncbi:aldo/keto reductase [Amycolatopsis azurea]|uniref:Oxidoreductase n=1 Tax=Amycolatopsis azurea DSM 43854 TaxID=1238180 RepID=M2QQV3_9PSEU|nr:aldo/keto reductase [Amycolatopsis azurea]EMD28202.1 oxidoreductase, aldo/keto reductase family protein [Amycolatopsis azurea DSM 43854]OOC05999.1 oxidoreductase [Amycolatopsis azurea DSM 43854]